MKTKRQLKKIGGSEGVRDLESLRAAAARPWSASSGQDHSPTPFAKAAAIADSIIRRHPFIDSNKRTAMYAARYLLETFGYELETEQKELEDFAVNVVLGKLETPDISLWFKNHVHEE